MKINWRHRRESERTETGVRRTSVARGAGRHDGLAASADVGRSRPGVSPGGPFALGRPRLAGGRPPVAGGRKVGRRLRADGSVESRHPARQEHLMNKVLSILRREILDLRAPLFGSELARLLDAMSELEHEAGRIAPLASDFNRHAQVIIDALLRASDTSAFPTL